MIDLQKTITEASARIVAAQKERAAREASALAHEQAAREDRLAMSALKKELGELDTALRQAGVQKITEDASAAAKAAQAQAEKVLERLAAKERELDARIAELGKPKE